MSKLALREDLRMVRYHPPMGLSTLFRLLPKETKRPTLNVSYPLGPDGGALRFSAREALGVPEQTLLLALLEIAQDVYARRPDAALLSRHNADDVAAGLWTRLNRGAADADGETIRFSSSWHELNARCGAATGGMNQRLRKAQLQRLCEVVVWEASPDPRHTTRQSYLVSWLVGDDQRLHLALNWRLGSALLGHRYAAVSLRERLDLRTDSARAIHAFLCTCIRAGNNLRIGVETLVQRLWPDDAADAPQGTIRRRRKAVRDALQEVGSLDGWLVEWSRADQAVVTRPQVGVRDRTRARSNANTGSLYRERSKQDAPCKSAPSRGIDVSGLFHTK